MSGPRDRARVIRALIRRDGLCCCFCGGAIRLDAPHQSKGQLSVEHVTPRSEGGTNRLSNLKLAHRGCNSYHGGHRTRPGLAALAAIYEVDSDAAEAVMARSVARGDALPDSA